LHINIYTKSSAEAMAKYLRTSKRLQRIHLGGELGADYQHREDILCCFLSAFQESTSLKEVCINFRLVGGPSKWALKKYDDPYTEFTVTEFNLFSWPTRRHSSDYRLVWIKKKHFSTRAQIGILAEHHCLAHID
jgi:hypothetical protein